MKFVYVGDPHERPTKPTNRTDDYFETYEKKVQEVLGLVKKNNAKALLQPGDFLDAPEFNIHFLEEVIQRWSIVPTYELLTELRLGTKTASEVTKELSKGIPFIGAIGNHELRGESIRNYHNTSLSYLEKIGFMILPTKEKPYIFTDDDGTTVAITCSGYHSKMDTPAFHDDYIIEKKMADFHIHMVHGYLTNKDMGDMFKHTTLDKIAYQTKADLTIAGHDHIGFGLTTVDGKQFINPGSMTRTKSDVKEIRRKPKALVIEVTKEAGVTVKQHYLKSAEEGKTVLSREAIDAKKLKSAKMEEIKSIVNKAQLSKGSSITSIITSISDVQDFDESLTQEVLDRVSDKMKDMDNSFEEDVPDYTIDKLVLKNFQGHADSELNFGKGLNVVIGESSHGKSAIYRALHWLYDNAGANPRKFIKAGESFAKVSAHLSNGTVVSRIVEEKKSGKNGYEVYDPADGTLEYTNTRGADDVRKLLGYNKIKLDTGKDVDINFMGQGESWFFIGDAYTSSERAKIVGSIFGTHYTDAVIKEMESDLKKLDIKKKAKEESLLKTTEDIETYEYLKVVESIIAEADLKEKALKEKIERKEKIESLIKLNEKLILEEKRLNTVLTGLSNINDCHLALYKAKDKIQLSQQLQRQHDIAEKLAANRKSVENTLKSLENLDELVKRINLLKKKELQASNLVAQLNQYEEINNKNNRLKETIVKGNAVLKRLKHLPELVLRVNDLKEKSSKAILLNELIEKRAVTTSRIAKGQKFISDSKLERDVLIHSYQEILTDAGTCPTCHGTIDNAVVNRIVATYSH